MTRARRPGVLIGLLLVLLAPRARASDASEAQRHYDAGIAHYRIGEFPEAIEEFKAAYSIAPSPSALFNLAQTYRQMGDVRKALFFYRCFVADAPPSRAQDDARVFIEQLSTQPPAPSPAEPRLAGIAAARPSRRVSIALVAATAGGGAALLATAIGLSSYARGTSASLGAAPPGTTWSRADAARYAHGRAAADASIALSVVGASALAASVVSAIVCRRSLSRERAVRVAVSSGGARWTF